MIPLALPDDAASMYAYTPPVLVKHEASASTSGPNARIPPHLALAATPRSTSEAAYATREFVDMVDPIDELAREIFKKADATRQATSAYRERIVELINDAAPDGISLNEASEGDFWTFIMAQNFFWKNKLFLLDNGNLRAVWKSETGDQIGLQFLGNGTIQYVIFKHRPRAEFVSRVAGRDTLDGVRGQISALDLDNLIAA
jgi:hypothetical protein